MLRGKGDKLRQTALSIYAIAVNMLLLFSGTFHLLAKGTTVSFVMQLLDHSAIYIMIASSFTPFHIILMRGYQRWLVLAGIWTLAVIGILLTVFSFKVLPEGVLLSGYLFMGWMSIYTIVQVGKIYPSIIPFIISGCLLYTLGAVCDFLDWPIIITGILGPHEWFHLCILAAIYQHWKAINAIAIYPTTQSIKVHITEGPVEYHAHLPNTMLIAQANSLSELEDNINLWLSKVIPKAIQPHWLELHIVKRKRLNRHSIVPA